MSVSRSLIGLVSPGQADCTESPGRRRTVRPGRPKLSSAWPRRPPALPPDRARPRTATGPCGRSAAAARARSGSRATSARASTSRSRSSRARARRPRAPSARRRPRRGSATSAACARTGSARDASHVYIAYEYVPGQTFRQALRAGELNDARRGRGRRADPRRARARARARDRPPRREAVERPARRRRPELSVTAARLRARALRRGGDADRGRRRARDARLHLARAARARRGGAARQPTSGPSASCSGRRSPGWHPFWHGVAARDGEADRGAARRRSRRRGPTCRSRSSRSSTAMLSSTRRKRPPAAQLAADAARRLAQPARRRKPRTTLPPRCRASRPGGPAVARRRSSPAGRPPTLPFYPARWSPRCSPLLAGALTLRATAARARLRARRARAPARQRLVGPRARSTPRSPCAWLALSWRDAPRTGCFLALGPLLAPSLALGLLPLAAQAIRNPVAARAAGRDGGAARRGGRRPRGTRRCRSPAPRRRRASGSPGAPTRSPWPRRSGRLLQSHPALVLEAVVLAARRRRDPLRPRARPLVDRRPRRGA